MKKTPKVFSTGQTAKDFVQLAEMATYLPKSVTAGYTLPEALTNPSYVPRNRGYMLISLNALTFVLALAAVACRLYYAKYRSRYGRFLTEDYLIVAGLLLVGVVSGFSSYGAVELQWGYKLTDLKVRSMEITAKILFSFQYLVVWAMSILRIAITLFFRRLYAQTGSRMIWFCNVIIILSLVYIASSTLVSTFSCNPVSGGYDIWVRVKTSGCGAGGIYLSGAVMAIIMDIAVVLVPIRLVTTLSTTWKRKLEMLAILSVGCCTWIASIARLWFVRESARFLWDEAINAVLCSQFEMSIAIVCACAPMIKGLCVRRHAEEDLESRIVRTVKEIRRAKTATEVEIVAEPEKSAATGTTATVPEMEEEKDSIEPVRLEVSEGSTSAMTSTRESSYSELDVENFRGLHVRQSDRLSVVDN